MPPKVSLDTRIRRRNFSFHKMLTPRQASQVLSNILGNLPFKDFVHCEKVGNVFTARIEYEDQSFESSGESRREAENLCSEKVLMYITAKSFSEEVVDEKRESSIPWVELASLALFKMFNAWQTKGCPLPKTATGDQNRSSSEKNTRKEKLPLISPETSQEVPKQSHIYSYEDVKSSEVAKVVPGVFSSKPCELDNLTWDDESNNANKFEKGLDQMFGKVKVKLSTEYSYSEISPSRENAGTRTLTNDFISNPSQKSSYAEASVKMSSTNASSNRCETQDSSISLPSSSTPWSSPSSLSPPSPSPQWSTPSWSTPSRSSYYHPVTLLNELAGPNLVFTEVARNDKYVTVGVAVNGATFYGGAANKKDARTVAAFNALEFLFNITCPNK